MKIAYVGLGNLGGHLATSIRRAGYDLVVTDLNRDAATDLLAAGASWADDAAAAAESADVVFTCLPSPRAIEIVLAGDRGILSTLKSGGVWIDNSTNDRDLLMRLANVAAAQGVRPIEAPVTGGVHLAASGEITVIVGADVADFEEYRVLFEAIGGKVFHVGPIGQASVIKVITNMLAFIHLVACGEALMLAKQGGLDLRQAWEVIRASSGNSFVHETEGQVILNGSYDIGFTIDLALKDLTFADQLGSEFGVPLDLVSMTRQTFVRARSEYGGDAWSSQVVKLLEDAVGTDLRAPGFPDRIEA